MAFNNFWEKKIGRTNITRIDVVGGATLAGAVSLAGLVLVSPGIQQRIGGPVAEQVGPLIDELAKGAALTDETAPRVGSQGFDHIIEGPSPTEYQAPNWLIGAAQGYDAGKLAVCNFVLPSELC